MGARRLQIVCSQMITRHPIAGSRKDDWTRMQGSGYPLCRISDKTLYGIPELSRQIERPVRVRTTTISLVISTSQRFVGAYFVSCRLFAAVPRV